MAPNAPTTRLTTHQLAAATILDFELGVAHIDDLMRNSGTTRRTWDALAARGLIDIEDDGTVVTTGLISALRGVG